MKLHEKYSSVTSGIATALGGAVTSALISIIWSKYVISSLKKYMGHSNVAMGLNNPTLKSILDSGALSKALNSLNGMQKSSIQFLQNTLQTNPGLKHLSAFLDVKPNIRALKIFLKNDTCRDALSKFLQGTLNETALAKILNSKAHLIQAINNAAANKELMASLASLLPNENAMKAFNKVLRNPNELAAFKNVIRYNNSDSLGQISSILKTQSTNLQNRIISGEKILIALVISFVIIGITSLILAIASYKYYNLKKVPTTDASQEKSPQEKHTMQNIFYMIVGLCLLLGVEVTFLCGVIMASLPSLKNILFNIADNSGKTLPIITTLLVFALPIILLVAGYSISWEKSTILDDPKVDTEQQQQHKN